MAVADAGSSLKPVSIIDAPSSLGLRRSGVEGLPAALREAGLLDGLPGAARAGEVQVPDGVPEADSETGVRNARGIVDFSFRLAESVEAALDLDRFPLVLGGDCSILLGPALALRRRGRYGLFFVDGHADFYSPEAEPEGEAASMDLALVTGHGPDLLTDLDGLAPLVREEDAVVFGFRDEESATAHGSPDVRKTDMQVLDLPRVRATGPAAAAKRALERLERNGVDGFWIHVDADVLDDAVMPAVDYRMSGGLAPDELARALAVLLSSRLVAGMDITIYNPTLDDASRSAGRALAGAVTRAFGDAG